MSNELAIIDEMNLMRAQLRRTQLDLAAAQQQIEILRESNTSLAAAVKKLNA